MVEKSRKYYFIRINFFRLLAFWQQFLIAPDKYDEKGGLRHRGFQPIPAMSTWHLSTFFWESYFDLHFN